MARNDLLVTVVQAGMAGDREALARAVEAIIVDARATQHRVLADRLARALQCGDSGRRPETGGVAASPGHASRTARSPASERRARSCLAEMTPRRSFEDLFLTETCERACRDLVEEQHRASLLRGHGIDPRHRVLLVGPPGSGKTALAEAIAEALAISFLVVRYDAVIGDSPGETADRLRHVFDYARTMPCVLFFDEFDAVAKDRGDVNETGELKRVVASLLMQVDSLPGYTVVVAASSRPELLDRAVWPRFQLRVELAAPTQAQVARYLEAFAKTMDGSLGIGATALARSLGKVSYAEAEEFCCGIRRRLALSLGEGSLKAIVAEQLKLWRARASQPDTG